MNWTTAKYIADSRIVKTSYFWLMAVPITAKIFEKMEPNVIIYLFGQPFNMVLRLPFSWEVLFYASLSFSLANLIYLIKCPPIIRLYKHFSDFKEKGNTLLKIHREMHSMVADKNNRVKIEFNPLVTRYLGKYANGTMYTEYDAKSESTYFDLDNAFYDTNHADKLDVPSEAFHIAQEIGDRQHIISKFTTLALYTIGLLLMFYIICENIIFVITHSSIFPLLDQACP